MFMPVVFVRSLHRLPINGGGKSTYKRNVYDSSVGAYNLNESYLQEINKGEFMSKKYYLCLCFCGSCNSYGCSGTTPSATPAVEKSTVTDKRRTTKLPNPHRLSRQKRKKPFRPKLPTRRNHGGGNR
jgi:hypothetical protein